MIFISVRHRRRSAADVVIGALGLAVVLALATAAVSALICRPRAGRTCIRRPKPATGGPWEHGAVPPTTYQPNDRLARSSRRDPSNELYNRACDVLAAAGDLRAAAARDSNDAAVAATLRCLETALERAALATELLRDRSVRRVRSAWPVLGEDASITAGRLSDECAAACEAIRAASRACGELRGAVGPLLAELTAL